MIHPKLTSLKIKTETDALESVLSSGIFQMATNSSTQLSLNETEMKQFLRDQKAFLSQFNQVNSEMNPGEHIQKLEEFSHSQDFSKNPPSVNSKKSAEFFQNRGHNEITFSDFENEESQDRNEAISSKLGRLIETMEDEIDFTQTISERPKRQNQQIELRPKSIDIQLPKSIIYEMPNEESDISYSVSRAPGFNSMNNSTLKNIPMKSLIIRTILWKYKHKL